MYNNHLCTCIVSIYVSVSVCIAMCVIQKVESVYDMTIALW